jgi:apolipoprotein N-acyltransferase
MEFGLILFPFFWVAVEYLRSHAAFFPWVNLSYTGRQSTDRAALRIAAMLPSSFFVIVVGILLYLGYRNARQTVRASLIFASGAGSLCCCLPLGSSQIQPVTGNFEIAALRNIPISQKWPGGPDSV